MKIHVLIPSKGRAKSLETVIGALQQLESGENVVRYTVLIDFGDAETEAAAERVGAEVVEGEGLVNARENALIAASDADAFMPWADDLLALAPGWDEITRLALEKVPAFSWREVQDPENHTAIVLSAKWVRAAGRFFPEHFPFWFSDTWLKEVYGFVSGRNMPIIEQLSFSHKRTPTQNMHDLAFWFTVFARTRDERVEESKRVAAAMGEEWESKPWLVVMFEQGDQMQLQRVPQYEAAFGAGKGEQSESYKAAKARAERRFQPRHIFEEAA